MKKLILLLFVLPLFVAAQDLPTIYTESREEGKYIERGKILEEEYQDFLQNIDEEPYLNEEYEDWGEECNKILDYYNRYGTITERMWIDIDCVCSPFCYLGNHSSTKNASSTLSSHGNYNYNVSNMTDDDPRTAWVEGKSDYGIGESFEWNLGDDYSTTYILNGLQKSIKLWKYNSRVKTFKVYYDNVAICYLQLEDNMLIQYFNLEEILFDEKEFFVEGIFRFEIVDIYPGEKWKDVCISEIMHYSPH